MSSPSDRISPCWRFLSADGKTMMEAKADPDELVRGTKHEMEHTSDVNEARQIALDHLREWPTYYTALEKLEELLKAGIPPSEWGKPK